MADEGVDITTSRIREWKSIVTLIVFVLTNCIVLCPFPVPIYVPRTWADKVHDLLVKWRIIVSRHDHPTHVARRTSRLTGLPRRFIRYNFPMNFITAPLIADLFLLAVGAIGRREVKEGTIGSDNIKPYDIMIFFITLAYIAISIDASGLIRYLAFKVLQWGGRVGHRLFFYLYALWAVLSAAVGNDPVILSGTAFLAYMTRVSSNIVHPRAWIHSQFALANIGSAILVTSNPTNLVLAGAFEIKFVEYTAYMIVPVALTVIVLFPFLLYIVFQDEALIPQSIKMHDLPEEARARKPVNPNIPNARGAADEDQNTDDNDQTKLLSLEEIMNPFLDKGGAAFGGIIMAATLATVLGINASASDDKEHFVFYVTLPAAFVMFSWDMVFGWIHRHETREIAARGRQELEEARREKAARRERGDQTPGHAENSLLAGAVQNAEESHNGPDKATELKTLTPNATNSLSPPTLVISEDGDGPINREKVPDESQDHDRSTRDRTDTDLPRNTNMEATSTDSAEQTREKQGMSTHVGSDAMATREDGPQRTSIDSLLRRGHRWAQETFPTPVAVLTHLPFALVPFAFAMFVLVQALVTKGWVPVFAHGWDHWVEKTGTVGAIGGMGFLGVILSNFAGTNIGTTILLSRVIQAWVEIHRSGNNNSPITERNFWATVYSMAIGVNYGAFSIAFSASLAGLLWRDILERKHITIRALEFARVNLPIIAISMTVGCVVLIGEVYIMYSDKKYYVVPEL
ncbi:hypothetical protein NLU13_7144 [Sarocladium strictum]|uniref:Citrate transporter-like domain-containing protein n=1 Tax=Sarocladium strictum TaxID=5046 RepID=A0AA39L6P4_SARSR|nr:hypothetical protein NLU13_7144 [Sarocladium strictum]